MTWGRAAMGMWIAVAMIACGSERSDPAEPKGTFVPPRASATSELDDPVQQKAALQRVFERFAEAELADATDPAKPKAKALRDELLEPLVRVCVEAKLDTSDRSKLVRIVAESRDPRAEPCFKKTLRDYVPDTSEQDVAQVLEAVAAMKMRSLAPEVMKVYRSTEFSRMAAKPLRAWIHKALKVVCDTSHEDAFLAMIDVPIELTQSPTPEQVNQGFWQQTAIIMLGELKSAKAARPLMKLILTPAKGPLVQTAVVSLVKIGRPSIAVAEAVLKGEDKELLSHHVTALLESAEKDSNGTVPEAVQKAAKKAYLPITAEVLGSLGSEASAPPLLATIDAAKDDPGTKAIIALTLTLLPRSRAAIDAYKRVYEETPLDLDIPAGSAKQLLASRANDFFDPALVPWLVKTSLALRGDSSEVDAARQIAFVAAVKLMTVDKIAEVTKLRDTKAITWLEDEKSGREVKKVTTVGAIYKEQFDQAKAVLDTCKSDVACYLERATSADNQKKEREFTAIKAMFMIGILGTDAHRDQLVDALPKVSNMAVRATGLKAVEAMTPRNGVGPAEKLEKLYAAAEELKDNRMVAEYQIFLQTAARLRARQ